MPTAEIDIGNSCGYVEEVVVAGSVEVHKPRKSNEAQAATNTGVVVTRKYCVGRSGHSGGHTFRTT